MKIKYCHIGLLKRIQNKYKISRPGPKISRHLKPRNIYIIQYCIMREGVPFNFNSIEDRIREEKEELVSSIEDDLSYKVKLDIEVQIVAKLPEKEYEKMNLVIERFIL